ncbi:TPA: hypothetical protein OUC50_001456 [Proteus mirabilis]|uniref:hypothetical protein n=1 Tax=Proteus mirabilis TaxID=584 RepID=UPI0022986588|nr:hypothetical protein [Proteus mirabilis]MDM3704287.1 hypothetical protein [Proteus mirabilis]MDM3719365.1 hypothetical protein [Proteus mirabilis]HCT1987748.1 hypothetical protein [Proteus mirabilis]HCT9437906.1 hypothetical protein [Proteus mirabilis]HEI8521389.1 hypothetical protein [Proteus mirabilis]
MINKEMLKNLKYFEKTPLIHHINYPLTEDAKKNILNGWLPACMEDKWLSYSIENCVYVHRSWSGHLMYKFTIDNNTIDFIEIAMDDFVDMTNERKIEVFFSLLPYLSQPH